MLKSYAAFYHDGQLEWIDDQPKENHFKMIVTIVESFPEVNKENNSQNTFDSDLSPIIGILPAHIDVQAEYRQYLLTKYQ
jgi:hypothetical protein